MLACHGPWLHHVRVLSLDAATEAHEWLESQGKKEFKDFEILDQPIEHKRTTKYVTAPRGVGKSAPHPVIKQSIEPIIFLNDVTLASYIKLTWGI